MKTFKGKNLVTMEDWTDSFEKCCEIGDYVEKQIVDELMNRVPPACMWKSCLQCGTPYDHKEDPDTGKERPTFATFKPVTENIYEYCGNCFRGETEERGVEISMFPRI